MVFDAILKFHDSLSDSTKRFEDRVLQAIQLLGHCHNQWYMELSKALYPLIVNGDIPKTYELYAEFLYEESKYQLPAVQAVAIIDEAEGRMRDARTRQAMNRLRLGTFLLFRWLDTSGGKYVCAFCYQTNSPRNRYRFGQSIQGTWALLKYGSNFVVESAVPLEDFLKSNGRIVLPEGNAVSIGEIQEFIRSQLDALGTLLREMARDIGIINARSDFLRGIDLKSPPQKPLSLVELEKQDVSGTQIYRLMHQATAIWKLHLQTPYDLQLSSGIDYDDLEKTTQE